MMCLAKQKHTTTTKKVLSKSQFLDFNVLSTAAAQGHHRMGHHRMGHHRMGHPG